MLWSGEILSLSICSLMNESLESYLFRMNVVKSALRDPRFPPISKSEIPHLICGVSLLTQFEEATAWNDWQVGLHGIILKFAVNGRSYSGTYLPDVASEQGWDHVQTVHSLARKAGYRGDVTESMLEQMVVTRYQSEKVKLSFEEYVAFKTSSP